MTLFDCGAADDFGGAPIRCQRHREGPSADGVARCERTVDVPPYECCDCVAERDTFIRDALSVQDRMDRRVGEFERYGEFRDGA